MFICSTICACFVFALCKTNFDLIWMMMTMKIVKTTTATTAIITTIIIMIINNTNNNNNNNDNNNNNNYNGNITIRHRLSRRQYDKQAI